MQIKLKNSVTQDSTPSTSDLPEVGELAVKAVMCHIVEKINKGDEDEV